MKEVVDGRLYLRGSVLCRKFPNTVRRIAQPEQLDLTRECRSAKAESGGRNSDPRFFLLAILVIWFPFPQPLSSL